MTLSRRPRSIRWRLAALLTALFVLLGGTLLGVIYALVRANLTVDAQQLHDTAAERLGLERRRDHNPPGSRPQQARRVLAQIQEVQEERADEALRELTVQYLSIMGAMTVLSAALGWFVSGRVLRPVNEITAAARRVSRESLHERIALEGPDDELKDRPARARRAAGHGLPAGGESRRGPSGRVAAGGERRRRPSGLGVTDRRARRIDCMPRFAWPVAVAVTLLVAGCGEADEPATGVGRDRPVESPAEPDPGADRAEPIPPARCKRVARRLADQTLGSAQATATGAGCPLRVVSEDDESLPVTDDYNPSRINVEIAGGRIASVVGLF